MINVEKGGAVALIINEAKQVLVVPDMIKENKGKEERLGWDVDGEIIQVDGRQFAGGVQGDGEAKKETAIREIEEETRIRPDPDSVEPLGVSTLIFHKRPEDKGAYYGVELFTWFVNLEEENVLRERGAIEMEVVFEELRPRDKIVIQLYYEVTGLMLPQLTRLVDEAVV